MKITFTVLGKPEPQGSIRAFMVGGRARLTSDNAEMKPWRQQVGWEGLRVRDNDTIPFGQHVPVRVEYNFVLQPLKNKSKGRFLPSVKPDLDKLCRSCSDALTGILWLDDGQICEMVARKTYGLPPRTEITVESLAPDMFGGEVMQRNDTEVAALKQELANARAAVRRKKRRIEIDEQANAETVEGLRKALTGMEVKG